ncbi:MAG: hypothetical protein GX575_31035 [Candidatus Anammoximicrobium sp.]|nr:hypothetical protein [Candidatus Anammoximicrobium sp.]
MKTILRNLSAVVAAILVLIPAPAALQSQDTLTPVPSAAEKSAEAAKLVAVLQSDAAPFDKAKACQRLALIGGKEAVPALAALLADQRLNSYARFGLEPIPDPSVDDALREALDRLQGPLLVGVINSVGVRRDAKAVDALSKLTSSPDQDVSAKTLAALGQIACPQAVESLSRALASDSAAVRAAAAAACLVAGERLGAQDKRDEAARLYDAARRADVPTQLRAAATRGAILSRRSDGVPLLLEQLTADDALFAIALRTSRELSGNNVTRALLAELDRLSAGRRALLIQAIGDRQDASASPAIRAWAAAGSPEVRVAALHVLGQLGDVAAVPVLLDAVVSGDPGLAQAAHESLVKLGGTAAGEAIVAKLDRAAPAARAVLLDLAGQLAILAAIPAALRAADDPDDQVRLAAIKTLGRLAGLKEFALLCDRLLAASSPSETAAVQEALRVACLRMPDPDACVGTMLQAMPKAPIASRCFLVELLGAVGGDRALKAVSSAAQESNEELQDAATAALGKWTSADAAPELLKLAQTLPAEKFRTRALRGYLRIAQQMVLPPEQKLKMCQAAFQAARRDEERRLVLNVLGGLPTAEAMSLVVPNLSRPALAPQAAAAALAIGEKIMHTEPRTVADAMRQVLKSGVSGDQAKQAERLLKRAGP